MALDKETIEAIRMIVREELHRIPPACPIEHKKSAPNPITIREFAGWLVLGVVAFLTFIAVSRVVYEMCKAALPF